MAGKSVNSKTKGKQTIRLPGGRSKVAVKQKRSSRVVCAVTGKPLQAVPQARSAKYKQSLSQKEDLKDLMVEFYLLRQQENY